MIFTRKQAGLARTASGALLACAMLWLSGCERQVPRTDYFPLRDGNRWEYRLLDRPMLEAMEQGATIQTDEHATDEDPEPIRIDAAPQAEVVAAEEMKPGAKADGKAEANDPAAAPPVITRKARRMALTLLESLDPLTHRALYGQYEQVWSKRGGYVGFQNAAGRTYLLMLPPHSSYRWVVTDAKGDNLYYEIEKHEDLDTPAGLFRACAVSRQESRDKRVAFRYWFAPDVGLVRRSKYYYETEVFRQELMEYKVRPATASVREAEEDEIKRALMGNKRGQEFFRKPKSKEADPGPLINPDEP